MKKIVSNILLLNLALISLVMTSSCQKVIDIDLNEAAKKIVIEANFNATDSLVTVRVSYTSNYFGAYNPDVVNDAVVIITDGLNSSTSIPFEANGIYKLIAYAPTTGMNYTITVTHAGKNHTSSSQLLSQLDMLTPTSQFFEQGFFGEPGGYLTFFRFQDPVGIGNYYNVIAQANDTLYNKANEITLGDDQFTDGNLVERPVFTGYYKIGDTITYELQAINKKMYDYYTELQTIAGGGQGSAAPGNPGYFWTNEGLGYFSAYYYTKNGLRIIE